MIHLMVARSSMYMPNLGALHKALFKTSRLETVRVGCMSERIPSDHPAFYSHRVPGLALSPGSTHSFNFGSLRKLPVMSSKLRPVRFIASSVPPGLTTRRVRGPYFCIIVYGLQSFLKKNKEAGVQVR